MREFDRRDGGVFEKDFYADVELSPAHFSNLKRRRLHCADRVFKGRIQYKLYF